MGKSENVMVRQAPHFFVMAAFTFAALCVFNVVVDDLPPLAIAVIWAVSSAFFAIAMAYPAVIKKINTKEMFLDSSEVAKRINGRIFRLIGCFALSAVLVASLLVESQKWSALEWFIAFASIFGYYLVTVFVSKYIAERQYRPVYRRRAIMLWSWVIAGALLLLVLFAVAVSSGDFTFSLSDNRQLFEDASSVLLQEVGKVRYASDSLATYGLGEISMFSGPLSIVISAVIRASVAIALVHLWSFCSLGLADIKQVFFPLPGMEEVPRLKVKTIASAFSILLLCAALCIVAFMWGEGKMGEIRQSDGSTLVDAAVSEFSHVQAYSINGKYYDSKDVDDAVEKLLAESNEYSTAYNNLEQAIRDAYGKCKENADGYLNSLQDDSQNQGPLERIGNWFNSLFGPADATPASLRDEIFDDDAFSSVYACVDEYNAVRSTLESQVESKLLSMGFSDIEGTIVKTSASIDKYFPDVSRDDLPVRDVPDVNSLGTEEARATLFSIIDADCEATLAKVPVTEVRQKD